MPAVTILVNALLFQAAWFAAVLGAASGYPWLGVGAVLLVVGWHLARAPRPGRELVLLGVALATGAVFENALARSGWVSFDAGAPAAEMAPFWIVALWANFATTLNVSLRALRGRLMLAAALGAFGAPLAYLAGNRLGAIAFADATAALLAIGAGWLLLAPLLFASAARLDGYAAR